MVRRQKRETHGKRTLQGKQILVFGLGLLGGGLATTTWLLSQGAQVRVTDQKDKSALRTSLERLPKNPRLAFSLGGHDEKDIHWADMIVVNPGVPREHPLIRLAQMLNKVVLNETALFFAHTQRPIIGVTGTRGKTTVTSWIAILLSTPKRKIVPSGNTPENPFLSEIQKKIPHTIPVVGELSSWQLEFLPVVTRSPQISVITNLYPDHLNRYARIEDYADAKANIFLNQSEKDTLILSKGNAWTSYFLNKNPKARILFVSGKPLEKNEEGYGIEKEYIVCVEGGKKTPIVSIKKFRAEFGEHNVINLLHAVAAARAWNPNLRISEKKILALKTPRFRQEVVFTSRKLTVVNDTTATSPDGTIAAIQRFKREGQVILLAGGTNKQLEFSGLAQEIKKMLSPENCFLLEGSATALLAGELKKLAWKSGPWEHPYKTFSEMIEAAFFQSKTLKGKTIILFSPGAASFEKFKNEFDRGEQFHMLIQKLSATKRKKM